jgi:hypothetical protein
MGALDKVLPAIEKLAPMIATGLGGPLIGGAVAALEGVFGITPEAGQTMDERQETLATAVAGATPDQLMGMRKADQDYKARMAEAGFKNQEALAALAVQRELAYLSDVQDARKANAQNPRVFWFGMVVMLTFAVVMGGALWGCYLLLTGQLTVKDAATVAMVSGFVGTILGYVGANAQQVVGFVFGGSQDSAHQAQAMSDAFSATFSKAGGTVK